MAIEFNEENINNNSPNVIKIILVVVAIIGIIVVFLFLNKNKQEEIEKTPTRMFPEISINFDFISSGEFRGLQEFDGIPVLPGFYDASNKQIEPENIEIGRSDPFGAVTDEEIKIAVSKVILKINDLKALQDLETSILSSNIYTDEQKSDLQEQIKKKIEEVEKEIEEGPQGEEIILETPPIKEEIIEVIEEVEEEINEIIEEVEEENTNKTKTW